MTYVTILTAIKAHSESTRFTQTAFVCLGQYSLSGYCQVSSRSMAFYDMKNFPWGFPRKLKCFACKEDAIAADLWQHRSN